MSEQQADLFTGGACKDEAALLSKVEVQRLEVAGEHAAWTPRGRVHVDNCRQDSQLEQIIARVQKI